jgi:hypothetical protein
MKDDLFAFMAQSIFAIVYRRLVRGSGTLKPLAP